MLSSARVPAIAAALAGLLLTSACNSAGGDSPPVSAPSLGVDPASLPVVSESAAAPTADATTTEPATRTTTRPAATATTAATGGSGTGSGGGSGVFSGTRQVYLLPQNSEATLGVVNGGKIGLSSSFGDKELFVLTPDTAGGDEFHIRTAKVRSGGEALCVSAKLGAGGRPGTVVTAGCNAAAADQIFRFRQTGESNGKPTYTIRTGADVFIIQDPTGEIAGTGVGVAAVKIGEGTADIDTPFVIPDKGKASLPALD
ncbi:hypothetical protein [Actinoplanes derwentensis]|uniref:Ricin B lectin domain-containing protein n=1 Tax=Actinoplanes derwentensis TaxID=113562 RepID=A0A1H1XN28_9ACTN|nr:hypothetical protein [Actinoplanes derwentensis]GID87715.1 hypothetical protein Ade03nite_66390 [Actinoplanes derwentensis]SDT10583.1 hypothetical protein SAMN04489716_2522 [Actinoplanes derwentensis]